MFRGYTILLSSYGFRHHIIIDVSPLVFVLECELNIFLKPFVGGFPLFLTLYRTIIT